LDVQTVAQTVVTSDSPVGPYIGSGARAAPERAKREQTCCTHSTIEKELPNG